MILRMTLKKPITTAVLAVLVSVSFPEPQPALLAQPAPAAQTGVRVDPSLYAGMRWRSLGPNRGGRSIAAAGSASRPHEYYFGTVGGGVWKTSDFGLTWAAVGDADFRTTSVGAIAIAPSNPDIVYAGMGESCFRGNIIQGDGVYKTSDAGKSWQHVGLADTEVVSKIRIHPTNPDIVYAAVLGHSYDAHPSRGVYRSKDGGKTWEKVLSRDDRSGAIDLSMDPRNPDVLFAATWQVYRTPWSMESGGPGSALYKSTDGGTTWTDITRNTGLPAGLWGRVGVSVSGADSARVYAIIENDNGGVYRLGRCGRDLAKDQRRPESATARVLLHAHLRRPRGQGHGLRPERQLLQVHRWRQDVSDADSRAARRQPRHVDRAQRQQADDRGQ